MRSKKVVNRKVSRKAASAARTAKASRKARKEPSWFKSFNRRVPDLLGV